MWIHPCLLHACAHSRRRGGGGCGQKLHVAQWGGTGKRPCGTFLAKAVTSACKQDGVLEEDLFPIYNLVWIGLYNGNKGPCAYTGRMRCFGYEEMEVLDSQANAQTLHGFHSDIANLQETLRWTDRLDSQER